ncbi:MAG TPA: hypothetical protein VMS17_22465 [Gemmataceae bacterium]|nr:hypothetical protein [Gemmataceae bacterium]
MTDIREMERPEAPAARRVSKKDQILTLYKAGITEVNDLAAITLSRPSYVAGVLQGADQAPGYFDLYTSTAKPMNVYSKFFAGKLGFRDEASAQESVDLIDTLYRQFELAGDRAGQHHALLMALTMFDRARWTNKEAEADVFRRWLRKRLDEPTSTAVTPAKK